MSVGSLNLFVSLSPNEESSDLFGLATIHEGCLLEMLKLAEDLGSVKAAYIPIFASMKKDGIGDVIVTGGFISPRKSLDERKSNEVRETGRGKFMLFGHESGHGRENIHGFLCMTEQEIVTAIKSVKDVYQEGKASNIYLSGRVRTDKNKVNYVSGKIGFFDTDRAEFLKLSLPGRKKNPFSEGASFQDVIDRRTTVKSRYQEEKIIAGEEVHTLPPPPAPKKTFHFFD